MAKLVFDFAGVVFSWQPLSLLRQVLPCHAVDDASAQVWMDRIFEGYRGDWGEFDRGTVAPEDLAERIARRTGLQPAEARAVIDAVPLSFKPVAGTLALLDRLHRAGRPLYFLSNMPAPYADHLDRHFDFLQAFDDGIYSARVRLIKPEPAIFALAARRFGVPPAELVFLDDVAANVQAARDAGWRALQFVDAVQCEAELQQAGLWPVGA
jgi:putative hydrolase of the HAD superfamily